MKKNIQLLLLAYGIVFLTVTIFTYGFVDNGLMQYASPSFIKLITHMRSFVLNNRHIAALVYITFISLLYLLYITTLRIVESNRITKALVFLCAWCLLLVISYPAFSYDIFNYILTSKIAFHYQENPYIVMPVEIPNEPALAYTRATNKVAPYGPIWIVATYIPYVLGQQNIWLTIFAYKLSNWFLFILYSFIIFRYTQSVSRTAFFALNPLVLVEVLVSGHNDFFMMVLAMVGMLLYPARSIAKNITGMVLLIASVFVKGATLPLVFIIPGVFKSKYFMWVVFIVLLAVFFVTPVREELNPWHAVWFLGIAPFLNGRYSDIIRRFCIVFSFGLLLRHAPYIYMGRYEGWGPFLRTTLTIIPPAIYIFILILHKVIKRNV